MNKPNFHKDDCAIPVHLSVLILVSEKKQSEYKNALESFSQTTSKIWNSSEDPKLFITLIPERNQMPNFLYTASSLTANKNWDTSWFTSAKILQLCKSNRSHPACLKSSGSGSRSTTLVWRPSSGSRSRSTTLVWRPMTKHNSVPVVV